MKIQVNDVDTHVAGACDADERVHVGAVHVNEAAGFVNDLADLFDVALEKAEGVGVGQHQAGDFTVSTKFAQVIEIGKSFGG